MCLTLQSISIYVHVLAGSKISRIVAKLNEKVKRWKTFFDTNALYLQKMV